MSAIRERAKRRRVLLTLALLGPKACGKLESLINGPVVDAGSEVKKNSVSPSGFNPARSAALVMIVPLALKFWTVDQITEDGCNAPS